MDVESLPALWAVFADAWSRRPTALVDPPMHTTAFEPFAPYPIVNQGIDWLTVTLAARHGAPEYVLRCPAVAGSWEQLLLTLQDKDWRRGVMFSVMPTDVPGQPSSFIDPWVNFPLGLRVALMDMLWPNRRVVGPIALDLSQLGPPDPWGHLNSACLTVFRRDWSPEIDSLTFQGAGSMNYGFFTGEFPILVDVVTFSRMTYTEWNPWPDPSVNYEMNPTTPGEQEETAAQIQWSGGSGENLEEIAALHVLAERIAASADRGGTLYDEKGRKLVSMAGAVTTLAPKRHTLESALHRLASALRGYAGIDLVVTARNGAQIAVPDGALVRALRRQ